MRFDDMRSAVRTEPFHPFRVHLSNGQSYDVFHPEFVGLTRNSVYVGVPAPSDEVPDRMIQCDLLHIVAIEPIVDGARRRD